MFKLALTGSIGMGKSATSAMFRDCGVPVWDADAAVHEIYGAGGAAVEPVRAAFPDAVVNDVVDRDRLSGMVLGDDAAIKTLESIVHPLVGEHRARFLQTAIDAGEKLIVLDIPLLFETGGGNKVDGIAVVSARAEQQRERVLARPGMTVEKFEAILARQVPDAEKRAGADHVIDTSTTLEQTTAQVQNLVAELRARLKSAFKLPVNCR